MLVLIKGAGDLASAIALRLYRSGFKIIMTDIEKPTTVRRTVSFSPAVYENKAVVEDVTGVLASSAQEAKKIIQENKIAILVDPQCHCLSALSPDIVVDAILAKKNIGTQITDAPFVVGIGPGFTPLKDCHCIVETQRGHYLGRVSYDEPAITNTGVPGMIGGYGRERIIRTGEMGRFNPKVSIGDMVKRGDVVATVINEKGEYQVLALIDGVVRGLLQPGSEVFRGMKAGDIDPRGVVKHCYTVSDKGSAIGGGVLEAICGYLHRQEKI